MLATFLFPKGKKQSTVKQELGSQAFSQTGPKKSL